MVEEGLEFVLLVLGFELWIDELGSGWDKSLEGDLVASFSGDESIRNIDEFTDDESIDRFEIGDDIFWIFESFVIDFLSHISCPFLVFGLFHRLVGVIVIVRLFDEESFISRCDISRWDLIVHRDIVIERSLTGFLEVEIGAILELIERDTLGECVEFVFDIDSFVLEWSIVEREFREHIHITEFSGGAHNVRK